MCLGGGKKDPKIIAERNKTLALSKLPVTATNISNNML
jgi:hypothetical protein